MARSRHPSGRRVRSALWSSAATLLLLLGGITSLRGQDERTVLVLNSDQALLPSVAIFTEALRQSVGASLTVRLEAQYLDLSRFPDDGHDRALADWLQSRYRDRHLPVVVTVGVPASAFATRFGKDIWPGARFVHASVDGDQAQVAAATGDPVVLRVLDYRRTLEFALSVLPDVRQVWLVAGASDQDRRWLDLAVADLAPLAGRVRVQTVAGLRWADLLERMANMPTDAIAIPVVFFADADGRVFVNADAIQEIVRRANRPVFVTWSWLF